MAGNVPALIAGFKYQELYGWFRILDLLGPSGKVATVSIEDPAASHFDDVTLRPLASTSHNVEFIQVKFHEHHGQVYSSSSLMAESHGLLLRKAWTTWGKLRNEFGAMELVLVTTWAWQPTDPLAPHIRDRRLSREFVASNVDAKVAAVRRGWWEYLGQPGEEAFREFLESLRFRMAYAATSELLEHIADRMRSYGLKDDVESARRGQDQVERWILDRHVTIARDDLEHAIEELDLRAVAVEPSITLYVHTVLKDPFETGAHYELDWRHYFEGSEGEKGHRLRNEEDWNRNLLPELYAMHASIRTDSACRFIRLRGMARLSPWFAVGYVFRESAGWALETDQYGERWRTDASPSDDLKVSVAEEPRNGPPEVVALGVSVSGDIRPDVRANLSRLGEPAGRVVFITMPNLGRGSIRSDGDLVLLARRLKLELQAMQPRAKRLLLFYWGPASGAVFVGHQLNAIAAEIQLFEEEAGEYSAAFTLSTPVSRA